MNRSIERYDDIPTVCYSRDLCDEQERRLFERRSFCFGLEGFDAGKLHAVDFGGEPRAPCNLVGGFQKFLRRGVSAHLANAGVGFDIAENLAGFLIRLLVIRLFANLDADAGVAVALVCPTHRVFLHRESVLGGLALDDLGNFLLRHFLFLRFLFLQFSLSACVYSRTIREIARPYVCIQSL